jgi:hypothetical protein
MSDMKKKKKNRVMRCKFEMNIPLSSQSLFAPEEEETELLRARRLSRSPGSFLTEVGELGLEFFTMEPDLEPLLRLCLRALLPARSSSKRRGRGRRWVRSYKPHLLQTILPGLRVDRRHDGGSVVWQLKQRRLRY